MSDWPAWPDMARRGCFFRYSRPPPETGRGVEVTAPVALVAGDRQADGIFPLWSIAANIGIRSIAGLRDGLLISKRREREFASRWISKIRIRTPDADNNILSLSGGNQQKTLFARALGSDAKIVLMDDPMRGVDYGTKLEVYDLIREEAQRRPHFPVAHHRDRRTRQLRSGLRFPQWSYRCRPRAGRNNGGKGDPVLVPGGRQAMTSVSAHRIVRLPVLGSTNFRRLLRTHATRHFASPNPYRHRLAQPARHQLFRLQPDAQSRDPDRTGDACPDVRHHRQRARPVDRHVRRLRRLRYSDVAARGAAVRRHCASRLRSGSMPASALSFTCATYRPSSLRSA